MSMVCRKTMRECRTPDMCAPFEGCAAPQSIQPSQEPMRRCKHDVSEDCPACAEETIAGLKAALLAIKAKTEGNRPTVNEQNAFEHFAELNARLVEIRALSRAALTGTRDLARGSGEPNG